MAIGHRYCRRTHASASPCLTRLIATRMDESFLLRRARPLTRPSRRLRRHARRGQARVAGGLGQMGAQNLSRPTGMSLAPGWSARKRNAAGTVTDGPWSPPQSMAIRLVMAKRQAVRAELPALLRTITRPLPSDLLAAMNPVEIWWRKCTHRSSARRPGAVGQEIVGTMHATL